MFCLGFYIGTVIIAFSILLFFTMLGGKSEDLWVPFVCAPVWPLLFLVKIKGFNI